MPGGRETHDPSLEKWHITLMEMTEAISCAFVSHGRPAPSANSDAEVAVRAIYERFRGSQLYIPISTRTERAFLHARIFQEFDGTNFNELARRHNMSVQAIYRITKNQREIQRIARGEFND